MELELSLVALLAITHSLSRMEWGLSLVALLAITHSLRRMEWGLSLVALLAITHSLIRMECELSVSPHFLSSIISYSLLQFHLDWSLFRINWSRPDGITMGAGILLFWDTLVQTYFPPTYSSSAASEEGTMATLVKVRKENKIWQQWTISYLPTYNHGILKSVWTWNNHPFFEWSRPEDMTCFEGESHFPFLLVIGSHYPESQHCICGENTVKGHEPDDYLIFLIV